MKRTIIPPPRIAIFELIGSMTRRTSRSLGNQLAAAAHDSEIDFIVLFVDSFGGEASSAWGLAESIRRAKATKPVNAYVDGAACSAAYWVTSQASQIWASPTAMIGSIGAYVAIEDTSQAFARQGVKVHVLRSQPQKGSPLPGEPVQDFQLTQAQALVDGLTEIFINDVSLGRAVDLPTAHAWADGSIYMASESLSQGLIDGIGSFEEALGAFTDRSRMPVTLEPQTDMKQIEPENSLIERIKALLGMGSSIPPTSLIPASRMNEQASVACDALIVNALADAKIVPSQAQPLRILAQAAWSDEQAVVDALKAFLSASEVHGLTTEKLANCPGLSRIPSDIKTNFMTEAAAYLGQDPLANQILAGLEGDHS